MKSFKFFSKPFDPRQYDIEGFTFIGVSPICFDLDGTNSARRYRKMIFMDNINHTAVSANLIYENEEPFHQADVIQIMGNQIFQLPRIPASYVNVTIGTNE
jgi:hypothetical protein